mmetsp:Transcript_28280/g.53159  ORF Transcript_28280/g.53159 Transcript_28280/m.53159 type:complete len:286 (+) Transcript_28280:276-1133(+)
MAVRAWLPLAVPPTISKTTQNPQNCTDHFLITPAFYISTTNHTMAIDKRTRDQGLSITTRNTGHVSARCFYVVDRSKTSSYCRRLPSILKRNNRVRYSKPHPLKLITSRVNIAAEQRTSYSITSPQKTLKFVLHDDATAPASFSPPPSDRIHSKTGSEESGTTATTNNVRFYNKVKVLRIPSRDQYPESIKRSMWCSLSEITENARRNTIEFSSEGWDWRVAIEEQDMYTHPHTGEHIHPVHVKREYQKRFQEAAEAASDREAAPTAVDVSSEPNAPILEAPAAA